VPLEHLDGIPADDAHIAQPPLLEGEQQAADARAVHLDAQVVPLRVGGGERDQVLAIAETDLEGARRGAREQPLQIERALDRVDAVLRPQGRECPLLRRGDPSRTGDEGADRARMCGIAHGAGTC
jgi:hypothetical protein